MAQAAAAQAQQMKHHVLDDRALPHPARKQLSNKLKKPSLPTS
jgi:hypothetical protein